jgi:hypothetical protein
MWEVAITLVLIAALFAAGFTLLGWVMVVLIEYFTEDNN